MQDPNEVYPPDPDGSYQQEQVKSLHRVALLLELVDMEMSQFQALDALPCHALARSLGMAVSVSLPALRQNSQWYRERGW